MNALTGGQPVQYLHMLSSADGPRYVLVNSAHVGDDQTCFQRCRTEEYLTITIVQLAPSNGNDNRIRDVLSRARSNMPQRPECRNDSCGRPHSTCDWYVSAESSVTPSS
jgi:hypothetical protein